MNSFEQFHGDLVTAASDLKKSPPLLIAVSKKQSLEKMHLVMKKDNFTLVRTTPKN